MTQDYTQRNFTIKAVALAIMLAVLLAAANAYLALKISITISASIPAAVLSIGVFRLFKKYSVHECNLVQTAASAGEGMASAAAFTLPAMLIFNYWTHFNYWTIVAIVSLGGVLGVFLSVPLRRILLNLPELKYPEGTAIGNVLKVSTTNQPGLLKFLLSGIAGGGVVSFLQNGVQVASSLLPIWFKARGALFGISLGFGPAALAAGFIIGPEVCASLFLGVVVGWIILIPVLSHVVGIPAGASHYDAVMMLASHHLRYVGVGTMILGGFWTLLKIIKPIGYGLKQSINLLHKKHLITEQERDIPMLGMGFGVLVFAALIFCFLAYLFNRFNLDLSFNFAIIALVITLLFIMIVGFILTVVCGYIAGVIGSSNSPVSSMMIITVLLIGSIYFALFNLHNVTEITKAIGLVLMVTSILGCMVAIGCENFQDLKAGQMIGATPWKQQVMLAVGVLAASLVLGPVLELLFRAYGIGGAFPHPGMDPSQMLSAPQAVLIGTLATGVITHQVDWTPIIYGAVIGAVVILVDILIVKRYFKFRLSALAVGMAIYLPSDLITAMVIGGVVHFILRAITAKRLRKESDQKHVHDMANLTACGLVAGAALMGVFLAIPFALSGNPMILTPHFAVSSHFTWASDVLGLISFVVLIRMLLKHQPKI